MEPAHRSHAFLEGQKDRRVSTTGARGQAFKIVLAVACIIVASCAAEFILRLVEPEVAGIGHQPLIYIPDAKRGYAYRPGGTDVILRNFEINNFVRINSQGFHDVERAPEVTVQRERIAVIGDSFTAALHVPVSNGWTQVLEKELNAGREWPLDVYNLGVDGTGTDVQLEILKAQYESGNTFQKVILAFFKNDVDDVKIGPVTREVRGNYVVTYQDEEQKQAIFRYLADQPPRLVKILFNRSYLFRSIYNALDHDNMLGDNFVGPKEAGIQIKRQFDYPDRLGDVLKDLKAMSDEKKFELLVVPIPVKDDPEGSLRVLKTAVSEEILAEIRVLDVTQPFRSIAAASGIKYQGLFWKYDGHLNAEGNRVLGLAVAGSMK